MAKAKATAQYRDVPGFPGYRAGDDGSVWSCWTKIMRRASGCRAAIGDTWRRLAPCGDRYPHVRLKRGQRIYQRTIHRLILETFVGPCPPGMQARHFPDRDTTNNRLSNLSWASKQTNEDDKKQHGTRPRGDQHWSRRLTA